MTDTRSLSPEDVAQSLRGPMGLIIGPGATSSMEFFSEASAHIASELKSAHGPSLFATGDMALDAGCDESAIIEQMCHYVERLSPNPMLSTLAKARWSAVLSICIDDFLEAQMRQATSTSAVMRPIRVVTDFLAADPGRVTPVYKLLGSADRRKIICSKRPGIPCGPGGGQRPAASAWRRSAAATFSRRFCRSSRLRLATWRASSIRCTSTCFGFATAH